MSRLPAYHSMPGAVVRIVVLTFTIAAAVALSGCGCKKKETTPSGGQVTEGGEQAPAAAGAVAAGTDMASRIMASFQAFNKHDMEGALAMASFELEYERIGGDKLKGKGNVRRAWEEMLKSFPDLTRQVRRVIELSEVVVVQYLETGTHKGPYQGIEATGKKVGAEGLMMFHSFDNEVKRVVVYQDANTFTEQIEGADVTALPTIMFGEGESDIVRGDDDRKDVETIRAWYGKFGPEMWKACRETHCTDDLIMHVMVDGSVLNNEVQRSTYFEDLAQAVSPGQFTDVWLEPSSQWYATFYTLKGKHAGTLFRFAPSGKELQVHFAEVMRIRDGKIAETWIYVNRKEIQDQIGQ